MLVEHLSELLMGLSVLSATVLGVVGFRENRAFQKQNNTVQLVSNFMLNPPLSESDFVMTRLINQGVVLAPDEVDDATDRHLVNLLDYYEFLATSYVEGALDKEIILHVRGGPMARAHAVCRDYIAARRGALAAPNLYRNYERLVAEYRERGLGL